MKKINIKEKLLTKEQEEVVSHEIVESMKMVYTDRGETPSEGFYKAAKSISEGVVKKIQMSLLQSNVYKKAVINSEPLKKTKKTK